MKNRLGKYAGEIEHRGNDSEVARHFQMEVNIIREINNPGNTDKNPLVRKAMKSKELIPHANKTKKLTRNISKPHSLYSPRGGGKRY